LCASVDDCIKFKLAWNDHTHFLAR
jgi:hypothetical protein